MLDDQIVLSVKYQKSKTCYTMMGNAEQDCVMLLWLESECSTECVLAVCAPTQTVWVGLAWSEGDIGKGERQSWCEEGYNSNDNGHYHSGVPRQETKPSSCLVVKDREGRCIIENSMRQCLRKDDSLSHKLWPGPNCQKRS